MPTVKELQKEVTALREQLGQLKNHNSDLNDQVVQLKNHYSQLIDHVNSRFEAVNNRFL